MSFNPKIDISVRTALSLIPNPGEAIGLIIGTAQYGPINQVLTFSDFTSVLDVFQEDRNANTTITKAAELFFANGGGVLKLLRIADSNALKSSIQIDGANATSNVIKFEAKYKGVYGNNIMIDIDAQGSGRIIRVMNGDKIELFDNNGDANGYANNTDLAAAINDSNNGSQFITATVNTAAKLVDATASYTQLESGDDGADGLASSDYTTAFDNLVSNEEWDFLAIPNSAQSVSIEDTDAFHTSIVAKVVNRASQYKKYSVYLSGISLNEAIATQQARTTAGERFVLFSPGIQHTSRIDGSTENLDGTYLACCGMGKLCELDETGQAITRKTIAINDLIVSTSTDKKYYTNTEIEQLLSSRICVASKISNALKFARGITRITSTTSIYFEINILRIVDRIKDSIQNTLDDYLGEPNSTLTRDRMAAVVNGILELAKNNGLLNEYTETVVTQGISPDTTNVAINIKPVFATNFISVIITVN